MKKLLHERLREFPECSFYDDLGETLGLGRKPDDEYLGEYWDRIIPALADEIERYYIPRPRFEDGEPIKNGDQTLLGTAEFVDVALDGSYALKELDPREPFFIGDPEELIPRPSPKVLDADGVEIKVGDTVWSKGKAEYIVEKVEDEDRIHLRRPFEDKALVKMTARCLSHKEPDSFEKLRDDMAAWNDLRMKTFCSEWIDLLTALIERDK